MRSFFIALFSNIVGCCKRHKILSVSLFIIVIISIVIGVIGGIQINNSMFPQDFSNVSYVRFLKGSSGFAGFFFTALLTILIFIFSIYLACCNKFLLPVGFLFLMYYVYAQTVTIISICMEFGFLNTIIIVIYLLFLSMASFILLILVFVHCVDCCGTMYFRLALKSLLPLFVIATVVTFINVLFLMMLKNYVIILVYK